MCSWILFYVHIIIIIRFKYTKTTDETTEEYNVESIWKRKFGTSLYGKQHWIIGMKVVLFIQIYVHNLLCRRWTWRQFVSLMIHEFHIWSESKSGIWEKLMTNYRILFTISWNISYETKSFPDNRMQLFNVTVRHLVRYIFSECDIFAWGFSLKWLCGQ